MSDEQSLRAETYRWEKKNTALMKQLQAMEQNGGEGHQVQGRNNLKKVNWE